MGGNVHKQTNRVWPLHPFIMALHFRAFIIIIIILPLYAWSKIRCTGANRRFKMLDSSTPEHCNSRSKIYFSTIPCSSPRVPHTAQFSYWCTCRASKIGMPAQYRVAGFSFGHSSMRIYLRKRMHQLKKRGKKWKGPPCHTDNQNKGCHEQHGIQQRCSRVYNLKII